MIFKLRPSQCVPHIKGLMAGHSRGQRSKGSEAPEPKSCLKGKLTFVQTSQWCDNKESKKQSGRQKKLVTKSKVSTRNVKKVVKNDWN